MNYSSFVPTLNASRTLEKTIKSIQNQTIKPERVIVIDSGSTDNTCEIARNLGVEVYEPKHWNMDFLGLAKARNRILELVDTEFLLSVDSDVELLPDYVQKISLEFEKHPEISGAGGKLVDLHRSRLGDKYRAVILMRDLYTPLFTKKEKFVDWLSGSQNIYCVSALKAVGNSVGSNEFRPFNDELNTNYEDIDIGNKLNACGFKIYYNPSIVAHHHQKDSIKSAINRHFRYRINEHIFDGNLDDTKRYDLKIDANIKEFEDALDLVLEKNRFSLLYPVFLLPIYLFASDIKYANEEIRDSILNAFARVADNEYLKKALSYFEIELEEAKTDVRLERLEAFLQNLLDFKFFGKEILDDSIEYTKNEDLLDFKNVQINFEDNKTSKTNYTICPKYEKYNEDEVVYELNGLGL